MRRRPRSDEPLSEQAAWGRLLRWFALRPRTERETRQRLARWNLPPDLRPPLLDRLRTAGLVDDAAFAEAFACELRGKGFSGAALRARLESRGVDRERAARVAGEHRPDDWPAEALALARRRAGHLGPLATHEERTRAVRRLAAYLARRGVPPAVAEAAAREAIGETKEHEE